MIIRTTVLVGMAHFHVVRAIGRSDNLLYIAGVLGIRPINSADSEEHTRNHVFVCTPVFLTVLNTLLNLDLHQWHKFLLACEVGCLGYPYVDQKGKQEVKQRTLSPLMAYQHGPFNPLFHKIFSALVPTWCHA